MLFQKAEPFQSNAFSWLIQKKFSSTISFNLNAPQVMANSNGVFSDLFNATGNSAQNLADNMVEGASSVTSVAQTYANLCISIATGAATTALKLMQDVTSGISSALTTKQ